jgi:hypothetical protein
MPHPTPSVQEQLDYHLAVDRLLSAAEQVRRQRDRLLESVRPDAGDESSRAAPTSKPATGQRGGQ